MSTAVVGLQYILSRRIDIVECRYSHSHVTWRDQFRHGSCQCAEVNDAAGPVAPALIGKAREIWGVLAAPTTFIRSPP
jgi:hypothetical protein